MKIKTVLAVVGAMLLLGADAGEKRFVGASGGSWNDDGNWTLSGVPTEADDVVIPADTVVVADGVVTAKSLTMEAGAGLSFFGASAVYSEAVKIEKSADHTISGYGRIAANATSTDAVGLSVVQDVTVADGAWIAVGGFSQMCAATVAVGGDLTLSPGAKMSVYAGPGESCTDIGSTLAVAGTLSVAANAWLELPVHVGVYNYKVDATAAHVGVTAGTFKVAAGGLVRSVVGCNEFTLTATASAGRAKSFDIAGSGHGGAGGWGRLSGGGAGAGRFDL